MTTTKKKPLKDRHGKTIKIGDVVAMAITLNHDRFQGSSFTVRICKRQGKGRVLDGAFGFMNTEDANPEELEILGPNTDLRSLEAHFIEKFGKKKSFNPSPCS